MQDADFMQEAIDLALQGKWYTAPNPMVGAVLVYKGQIIARGYHMAYGQAHAEVNCLLEAIALGVAQENGMEFSNPLLKIAYNNNYTTREKCKIAFSDCILYVTLEPCNHEGKTPPCTKAICESGIKQVVIGHLDPNPKASGGIETLKSHGILVKTDILNAKCEKLLADFLIWQHKKRPYVILKMATSLDGKIGPSSGGNHRISGQKSHEVLMELRKNIGLANGVILVGANTFIKDNPKLTVRTEQRAKNPRAVIIASDLLLKTTENTEFYCFENRPNEIILYCSFEQSNLQRAKKLEDKEINLITIPQNSKKSGLDLKVLLEDLYKNHACPYVLCEGGPTLGLNLLQEGLVDELILFMAPTVMGNDKMQSVFSGSNITAVSEALNFQIQEVKTVGEDLHIHLKPKQTLPREDKCLQD